MVRLALSLLAGLALAAHAEDLRPPDLPGAEPQEVIDARPPVPLDFVETRPPVPDVIELPTPEAIMVLLHSVMDDPQIERQVLAVDPSQWTRLPEPGVLIVADVLVRRGRLAAARQLYEHLLARSAEGSTWQQGARVGLGWIALVQNDPEGVRRYLGADGEHESQTPIARVLLALLDAGDARPGAAEQLERLSVAADVPPLLREVARIGIGYAYLWAEEHGAARRAFERVTDGRLADDAAYAAAWSRHLDGDDDGARAALQELAARPGDGARRRARRGSVRLEPRAVLNTGFARSKDLHVVSNEGWLGNAIDMDGVRLARAALRILEIADVDATVAAVEPIHATVAADRATAPSATAGVRPRGDATIERSWAWVVTGIGFVMALLFLVVRRPRHAR
jgi:hypothetical protein